MSEKTTPQRYDDPKPFPTFAILLIGATLVLVMVIGVSAVYFRAQKAEEQKKVVAVAPEELTLLRAGQLDQLNGYRWVKKDSVAAIPIDIAMQKTILKLNADRALAGGCGRSERRWSDFGRSGDRRHRGRLGLARSASMRIALVLLLLCAAAVIPASRALAQADVQTGAQVAAPAQADSASTDTGRGEPIPRELEGVGITEHLGVQVPLDVPFDDETGKQVTLALLLRQGPAGHPDPQLLHLPDALHTDPERPDRRDEADPLEAGARFRGRDGELRSLGDADAGAPEEEVVHGARTAGLAPPTAGTS